MQSGIPDEPALLGSGILLQFFDKITRAFGKLAMSLERTLKCRSGGVSMTLQSTCLRFRHLISPLNWRTGPDEPLTP